MSLSLLGTGSDLTRRRAVLHRTVAVAATALLLAGASAGSASAAPLTSTGSTIASVTVNNAIELSALTPSFTLTGNPGATITSTGAVSMNVKTNNTSGYSVSVVAAGDSLDPANTSANTDTIAIDRLKVRATNTTDWFPMDDEDVVTVTTKTSRSAEGGDSISNDYQLAVPFVNADTYSVTLNYVATTTL
jgi:hypothetical protein